MFEQIISFENLCAAWQEFLKGKKFKKDVVEFSLSLSHNLFTLYSELKSKTYEHYGYEAFTINDPKPRNIHKATVRDRVLHHAIYRILYPYFEPKFIYASYSCRDNKGTHRALSYFAQCARKISQNNTRTCWVLKCDIKKFFASIDHNIMMAVLRKYITDKDTVWLLEKVIGSFHTLSRKSLPLGNLTSQLLVNIYMNRFDHYMKRELKIRHYLRYTDDFVILSESRAFLENLIPAIKTFLNSELQLTLHPQKISIATWASGVDFLGWVNFPTHRVLRTSTKRRMIKKIAKFSNKETLESYRGLLSHGNTHKLQEKYLPPHLGKSYTVSFPS